MVKPLLDGIHCIESSHCKYPVAVKLIMRDGTVQTFTLDSVMSPKVHKAQCAFEESVQISIGYQYVPKRRNRVHRCKR